jgi:hypothetical protein
MGFKEQEARMLKILERKGLVRWVDHEKYEGQTPLYITGGTEKVRYLIGRTRVELRTPKGKKVKAYGIANCSVEEHSMDKRKGRVIATGRAMKQLGLPRW